MARSVVVIPARYSSTRFPGKVLTEILGKPMIMWVYERAGLISLADEVIVATDDLRIFNAVKDFGGRALMTSGSHQSGSDRIAEAALSLDCDIVVNVQGDEPLLDPEAVDLCIQELLQDPGQETITLRAPIRDVEELFDPNTVKLVCSADDYVLYFSRSPVPCVAELADAFKKRSLSKRRFRSSDITFYKHVGVYAYRKQFLIRFSQMAQTPLERAERLEQLRILENGYPIKALLTESIMKNVDVPEDVPAVEKLLRQLYFPQSP
ncbi:MAG: 3-deoxy-manno-octulosonate cytidylyltransferase [Candidatus Coatesbacteria bacterium]|nr:MAG: 3-deoxy-manno-octulosonate cytidylyltransferase [Candidatus Coatesbacteria bacterium]